MGSRGHRLSAGMAALFSAITVILALGLVEFGARLYYAARGSGVSSVELHAYWVDDPDTGYSLKPGYADAGIRVNSLGFRGPEISSAKLPRAFDRVVALGDSTTFGPRERECAYPTLLADLLRQREGNDHVEVVNAGVEGYRSDRALVHLRRDVLPLRPDLVTVFIGWNDLYQVDPNTDSTDLALQPSPVQRALTWSAAAQTVRRAYFDRVQPSIAPLFGAPVLEKQMLQTYRPGGYGSGLARIIDTIRSAGADAVVLTWPTLLDFDASSASPVRIQLPYHTHSLSALRDLYADYQAVLRRVAFDENVPVIDIASVFDGADKPSLFTDAIHFTCAGHEIVAAAIAPEISALLRERHARSR